jgi:hypothetical protein
MKQKLGIRTRLASLRSVEFEREVLSGAKWDFLGNFESESQAFLKKGGYGYTGDYVRPSSWGYYKGRLVLVDYGV